MPINNAAEKVRAVIDGLDRNGDKKVFPDNPNVPAFRTASIPTAEGECLKKWVTKERAVNAIEIGCAFGFSALHIGEGLRLNNVANPKHTIIDAWQTQENKYANLGLDILAKAGLDNIIEFYGEKSEIALPRLLGENRKFDFAFVDGCHLFDCVFVDLFYLGNLVKNGGIIFLDDYDKPGIRKAITFFIKNLGWKIEESGLNEKSDLNKKREWLVVRISEKGDTRQWNDFIDF
jgi:predicted O-methyltransferase YrrM